MQIMAIEAGQTRKESETRDIQHTLHQRSSSEFVFGRVVGKTLTVHFQVGAAILWLAIFGRWQKMQISV